MNDVCTRQSSALRPLDVVLIFVVAATFGCGFLLLSAAESVTLVDGAVEWQAESPLRAVVQLLCLNYQFPTLNAGDVKGYALGVGTGLAVLALAIAILARHRGAAEAYPHAADGGSDSPPARNGVGAIGRNQVSPLTAAQLLVGMYLLWSFASSRWSPAPGIAVGGSILLAIQFIWSLVVGGGMSRRAARICVRIVLAVTFAASIVGIWYFYGRNPTLRAKFPFGNPTFFSACLIQGIVWSITLGIEGLGDIFRKHVGPALTKVAFSVAVLVPATWAFVLADSRASQVGLAVAMLAIAFFAARGRGKLVPVFLAISLAVGAWWFFTSAAESSRSGRGDSLRLRGYAWNYALQMVQQRPITGYGQGGFALIGDSFSANDVLDDPPVFETRIEHTHNEWLETMADLGAIGIVLLCTALALTFRGGMVALDAHCVPGERWALIGGLAGLVGLIVEESAGVGLRVSEVPVAFYTLLGLTWALATPDTSRFLWWTSRASWRRGLMGCVGLLMAFSILLTTQLDFDAARAVNQTDEHLARGELDAAVISAERGKGRLSPQRELVSRSRLAEAHVLVAERILARAVDRERRARSSELPDPRLLGLAQADLSEVEEHVKSAGQVLKDLVECAPGFFNSGLLEHRISVVRAQVALMSGNDEAVEALRKNAVASMERELLRQPFNADLTISFSRVAGGEVPLERTVTVLARPLRYGRINEAYVEVLKRLAGAQGFDAEFEPLVEEAINRLGDPTSHDGEGNSPEIWAMERLRLAATIRFMRGDYSVAARLLAVAAKGYDLRIPQALSGGSSCHAELAEALFFTDPNAPQPAIEEARKSIAISPESRLGREWRSAVQQRLIQYELAADDEAEAIRLLRESAPSSATGEAIEHELGIRLRRLCESLLLHRREALILRKPPADLMPKLQRWLARAMEMNPGDYVAHFLAADLAMHLDDDVAAVEHLREALQFGLHSDDAVQFLRMAREQKPESAALESLWNELAPKVEQSDPLVTSPAAEQEPDSAPTTLPRHQTAPVAP